MWKIWFGFLILAILLSGCASQLVSSTVTPPAPLATATSIPATASARMKEWIVINLPPGASQLEYGAEVYRLVCQDCHGNRGQGLTDEWRATWAPADQNCWRSKCHAANHPPEGFILPMAPPVVGPATLYRFATALELHDFIHNKMPWYRPGILTEKDSWAATAHVLEMNHIHPGLNLDAETALQIRLH